MASEHLTQIIDYDGNIVTDAERFMTEKKITKSQFDYSVVTILGPQSSGKSTLLNGLFGCEFQVMNSSLGHSQTTKGLWLGVSKTDSQLSTHEIGIGSSDPSSSPPSSPLPLGVCSPPHRSIILDVEGSDSRERGEDRHTFEHRAALFALALADCVIINMWYHSLGNYTASNYGLLKTVLEVNLELFQQEKDASKTLLLFVIRDWSPAMTPLKTVEDIIKNDYITRIWNEIRKPDTLENSKSCDFFDYQIVGLPHKFMCPETFEAELRNLRNRWQKEWRPIKYSKMIPADGFSHYAENIWETIKRQSQLDIPSQKEMLSIYRCQEIKSAVLSKSRTEICEKHSFYSDSNDVKQFTEWAEQLVHHSLMEYDETACRYQHLTADRVKNELIDCLMVELHTIVENLATQYQQQLALIFLDILQSKYNRDSQDEDVISPTSAHVTILWPEFRRFCLSTMNEKLKDFDNLVDRCSVQIEKNSKSFNLKPLRESLKLCMKKDVELVRERQLNQFQKALTTCCSNGLQTLKELLSLRNITFTRFWDSCEKITQQARDHALAVLSTAYTGMEEESQIDQQIKNFEYVCSHEALSQLRIAVDNLVDNFVPIIVSRFVAEFNYDEHDQPRKWELVSSEDLQKAFLSAKEASLKIIPFLKNMGVKPSSVLPPGVQMVNSYYMSSVINEVQEKLIEKECIQEFQKICKEAQRAKVYGGQFSWRTVPPYIWLGILVLGWNEATALLSFLFGSWFLLPLILISSILGIASHITGSIGILNRVGFLSLDIVKTVVVPLVTRFLHSVANTLGGDVCRHAHHSIDESPSSTTDSSAVTSATTENSEPSKAAPPVSSNIPNDQ